MMDTFQAILDKHEADDDAQIREDALFLSAVKREFANSEEILNVANKLSIMVGDVVSGKVTDFPIIPIRQSDEFYIKKHTKSQFPYFHSHNFYELIYVRKGKCVQKFKDGAELRFTEKQCALITPKTVHLMEKCDRKDVVIKMIIPDKIFQQTGGTVLKDSLSDGVKVFNGVSETAEFIILKLLEEQYGKNKFKDLIIKSYLNVLFAELVEFQKTDTALETVLYRYFDENLKTASLFEFSTMQNYHPNYASRLIKQKTGTSFSDLLSRYRIDRAKDLLIETTLTVEDIAFEVGYSQPSGLYKQFFTVFGMKPKEYRNLFR